MHTVLTLIFGTKDHLDITQECARAVLVFFYGVIMLRLSGRRTFAGMSALDMVISIMAGSLLGRTISGSAPFAGTLIAVAVLVLLHVVVSHAVARSQALSKLVEGSSVRLATNGQVDETMRLRHKISISDIAEALRDHGLDGIADLGKVRKLELEPSGSISVIR